ncbi:MAG TPA: FHA domain-containing protein [Kofleriaceae bacterium]|nr:FHA domain-containing protein [Kofleriaceae bacterium]
MFKLVIQDDEGKTTVVPLIRDEITIGRKEGNTIRLTERNVSRRHARILRNNGEVQIEDLGSYNGIRVNNARIAERVSLRISDQVQIGDYKLYLKAEGVEQVDDARTMPIERIDNALPTEVMPAVQQPPAPAVAPAATPLPTPIAGTPPPNRSPVAVADTDPAGRPVATASQVAALTQAAGYGKLCVLSSNLAGKEFDLTRPQMIIGRTDENDIVINHRSISRNHAKITRDLETGRYTISDLQSSNGVRVNGQDYGKVELRRGDTVDLGHVRLRFVEPGEEFIFTQSMVADIPETGSKKGLLVAIILGVLVLGGVGAFFVLNGKKEGGGGKTSNEKGSNGEIVATNNGNGSDNGTGPGSEVAVNPVTNDGSNTGAAMPPPTDALGVARLECQEMQADGKWRELSNCSEKLAKLGDKDQATKYGKIAKSELENDTKAAKIAKETDYSKAKRDLEGIPDDSYYRAKAAAHVDSLRDHDLNVAVSKAKAMNNKGQCDQITKLANEVKNSIDAKAGEAVLAEKAGCVESGGSTTSTPPPPNCSTQLLNSSSACKKQFCKGSNLSDPACQTGSVGVTAPANCDADALKDKGMENINMGQHAAALAQFEASLRCKNDAYVLSLAFMAACNAQNAGKAKQYWNKLSGAQQSKFRQMCVRNHIDPSVP